MIVLISIFDTIVNLYKPRIPGQLYQICIKITIFNISRRDKNKERAKSQRLSSFFVLPWKDSNPHRRNQNPTCYHYTTRQFSYPKTSFSNRCRCAVRFTCAKLRTFFELANFSATFFELFLHPSLHFCQITLIISDITSRLKQAA